MSVRIWSSAFLLVMALAVAGVPLRGRQSESHARQSQPTAGLNGIDQGLALHAARDAQRPARARSLRDGASGGRYEPGRVIVKFRESASATSRASAMRATSAVASTQPSHADFEIMAIPPDADPEQVAASLSQRGDVEYAQAAYRVYPYFRPNDPLFTRQWNLIDIGMEQAWDINAGADSSVIVAVLDSGVAYRNALVDFVAFEFTDEFGSRYPALGRLTVPVAAAPDLANSTRIVAPRDFIYDDTEPYDLDGHGTHVSGTVGQLTNNGEGVAGMAFNVRIMPVKVISGVWDDIFRSPYVGTDDVVARGIRYAVDNGARVLNMSIGRSGPAAPAIESAIRYAVSQGAFIAVAGGNDFEEGNPVERIAEIASRVEGAISVGATGRDRTRAYYSSTGSYIEIVAPGGNRRQGGTDAMVLQQTFSFDFTDTFLLSPGQYRAPRFDVFAYVPFQGTSMATPHVAGLAALLMQQGITNPLAIEAAIRQFATDLGDTGKDNSYGYGLINPRATLRGLGLIR